MRVAREVIVEELDSQKESARLKPSAMSSEC